MDIRLLSLSASYLYLHKPVFFHFFSFAFSTILMLKKFKNFYPVTSDSCVATSASLLSWHMLWTTLYLLWSLGVCPGFCILSQSGSLYPSLFEFLFSSVGWYSIGQHGLGTVCSSLVLLMGFPLLWLPLSLLLWPQFLFELLFVSCPVLLPLVSFWFLGLPCVSLPDFWLHSLHCMILLVFHSWHPVM